MDFNPIAYLENPSHGNFKLGLHRIYALLDALGNPQDQLRVVHVAGSNGKGSTCAYLASVLHEAGYKTGLFTSPHVFSFTERIQVDGECIGMKDLRAVTLMVRDAVTFLDEPPTEFELVTAVALKYFALMACDVVVLEVGLGGRLDATNVIARPEVCVIAPIALDHTNYLGDTLAEIAAEKAGILKAGAAVVSAWQEPEAEETIRLACARKGLIPSFVQSDAVCIGSVGYSAVKERLMRSFSYRGAAYETRMLGSYQPYNAALALEVLERLRLKGFSLTEEIIAAGICNAYWPGRFEIVGTNPLIVIDGGHNPQGAQALVDSLKEVFPDIAPVFVVSALRDKDYPQMLSKIIELGSGFVCMQSDSPRALQAEALFQAVHAAGAQKETRILVAQNAQEAANMALSLAGRQGMVCAFGSLYSLADLREAFDIATKGRVSPCIC